MRGQNEYFAIKVGLAKAYWPVTLVFYLRCAYKNGMILITLVLNCITSVRTNVL